jgi:ferredoxin--NADP+ reductase
MQTTPEQPLRVAVVGAGPAAFYVVQHLLQGKGLQLRVDMFERLPTPYGLVRHGVAPDHQKIKTVTAVYQKLGQRPEFRFFGNVEFGTDLSLDDLLGHYHQVVFATGAQTDRRLGIPGEDLPGSHPATEFVAWYNGHPDYARLAFDLGCRSAVVIGAGNVAVDVARILCRTPDELARTDIADYALEALGRSRIVEVSLVGRRGPAQAAVTNPEVRELGELEGAEPLTLPDEVELDPLTREALDRDEDKTVRRKVEILQGYASRREPRPRRLWLRFLLSPTEILAGPDGRVAGVRFVRNVLCPGGDSELKARATDTFEELPAGLVFRSVGYRGVPLPGLPFRDDMGTIPAAAGRVLAAPGGAPLRGVYVAGWIKRGPSGVIGTNKPDAAETVASMLEDVARGAVSAASARSIESLLAERRVRPVSFDEWLRIDAAEIARGAPLGRPRVKFTDRQSLLSSLGA